MQMLQKTKLEAILSEENKEKAQVEEDVVMNDYNDNFVIVKGVLARKNFDHFIFDEDEISNYTSFEKIVLNQK